MNRVTVSIDRVSGSRTDDAEAAISITVRRANTRSRGLPEPRLVPPSAFVLTPRVDAPSCPTLDGDSRHSADARPTARSPASIRIGSRFSAGGIGQVANAVNAHGGLQARLKSIVVRPSMGAGTSRNLPPP